MPKKKSDSKSSTPSALTKEDLVNYIGPVFQDLKMEMKSMESKLKVEMKSMEARLNDKINWQGTLMEQMNKKIDTALEVSSTILKVEEKSKIHDERISSLEVKVNILTAVKSHS